MTGSFDLRPGRLQFTKNTAVLQLVCQFAILPSAMKYTKITV